MRAGGLKRGEMSWTYSERRLLLPAHNCETGRLLLCLLTRAAKLIGLGGGRLALSVGILLQGGALL